MGGFGATLSVSFLLPQKIISTRNGNLRGERLKFQLKKMKQNFQCFAAKDKKPSVLSLRFSSFDPLYESHGASFDQYSEDQPRLFRATFPGKSEHITKDEWRVQMPALQFLFLKISPVVDIRFKCRSNGKDYPFDIPHHISKVLELQLIRWRLEGLDKEFMPSNLRVCLKGALYAQRSGSKSVLINKLAIDVSFIPPTPITFFPEDVVHGLAQKGLKMMIEETRREFAGKLLLDYSKFTMEKRKDESSVECS